MITTRTELDATLEDHEKAFVEMCFLLDVLTGTIGHVVGKSTASLGISAGRYMAKRMPIYLDDPSLQEALDALAERMKGGFDFSASCDDAGADVGVGRCAIREVCKTRGTELGGDLCQMFHYYLAGLAAEMLHRPVRASAGTTGESCSVRLDSKSAA